MKKRIRRNFTLITAWILACSLLGCHSEENLSADGGCQPYFPSKHLSQAQFDSLTQDWYDRATSTFDKAKIQKFVTASEPEFIEAIYEMFSKPEEAHVFYGQYTAPNGGAKDGGTGFRVIWSKPVIQGEDRRLLNVITFWTYENGKLRLRSGHDTIRVRTQLSGDSAQGGAKFGGASLSTEVDPDGTVRKIHLTDYTDSTGKALATAPHESFASQCNGCHFGQLSHHISPPKKVGGGYPADMRDNFEVDTTDFTPEDSWNIRSFVTAFEDLKTMDFSQPRQTFFPKSLVEAAQQRCQELTP